MKTLYALLLAAAGAPPAISAPADQPAAQPYRSTFADYQRQPEPGQTPDQYWLQANRTVAAAGHAMGHAGMHDGEPETGKMQPGNARHGAMDQGQAAPGTADHHTMKHGAMDHSKMHHGSHGKHPDAAPPPVQHQHKDN